MTSLARVLVIGLDSADASLLREWSRSGDLPVLRALLGRSQWGRLLSPPGMADDGVWASFSTCVSPARHGRYFTRLLSPGSYDNPKFHDDDLKHETFWTTLDRVGLRQAIIDVPKTPLAKAFDGVQVRDWIVHGRDGATASWPQELAGELHSRFGRDTTDDWSTDGFLCHMTELEPPDLALLADNLSRSLQQKRQLSLELLDRGDWDLFLTVFKETHCAGHQFWHLQEQAHPRHDPSVANQLGDTIKTIYQAIDTAIGSLIERAGPETHVIVFTDLGMAANYTGEHLLDEVLERLEGCAVPERGAHGRPGRDAEIAPPGRFATGNRPHRRAFQVSHNEMSGAIRINLCGREPHGLVQPGREFEDLCDTLTRDLLDLENLATGEPVVREVLRTSEHLKGAQIDRLPDLFVVWHRDAPIERIGSEKLGEMEVRSPHVRTGNHIADGLYLLCGPGIEPGFRPEAASIMDIGPTIAELLGSSLAEVDGRSLVR